MGFKGRKEWGKQQMIIKNARIFTKGNLQKGSLLINEGAIDLIISEPSEINFASIKRDNLDGKELDCKGKMVIPGIIDIHSHLRDLGQINKESFETGTRAAISSGITTVFTMPNTIPPVINSKMVEKWMNEARGRIFTDVAFIAGVPREIDIVEIKNMISLGIIGFKIYPHSPLSGIDWKKSENIHKILSISSQFKIPLFVHPAWPLEESKIDKILQDPSISSYNLLKIHDRLNPKQYEAKYITFLLKNYLNLVKKNIFPSDNYPRVHFCHVSTIEGYNAIKKFISSNDKVKISFEVTPHHLLLSNKTKTTLETFGKVLPPLRAPEHSQFLFKEYIKGNVPLIGTDHAPHTLEEKSREFFDAPSGFPGFESYPLIMLEKVFENQISLNLFIKTASENPARIFHLKKKGFIKQGYGADFMIIDKVPQYLINPKTFQTKAKFSPFEDYKTTVKITKVILNGNEIDVTQNQPQGKIINLF